MDDAEREIRLALDCVLAAAEQAGVALAPPSVMDATRAQLLDADRRAAHAREAIRLIFGFTWDTAAYPTLGAFVRGLPEDVAAAVAAHLVAAGLS